MQRVLLLCPGNSCRSQMAEGLWRKLGEGRWAAHSAGSKPVGYVHPLAVQVMAEVGIDLAGARSTSVQGLAAETFDLVVTVCDGAREACPTLPGARRVLHWPCEDPADASGSAEERRAVFRRVRDAIEARIREFLAADAESA